MTELRYLNVGDEITLTIKAVVKKDYFGEEGYLLAIYAVGEEHIVLRPEYVKSGVITIYRAPRPLPTEPGVYVPANNKGWAQDSYIYKLKSNGVWVQFNTFKVTENALNEAEDAHRRLGGLVRLVPEQ